MADRVEARWRADDYTVDAAAVVAREPDPDSVVPPDLAARIAAILD